MTDETATSVEVECVYDNGCGKAEGECAVTCKAVLDALAFADRKSRPTEHPLVKGRCPACNGESLFLGSGGYVTCSRLDCPRPDLVNELIGEVGDARNHAAYTFCPQLVGHVNMTAFAKKITEKVTAVAHRAEAVAYANEQKQRADRAEQRLARIEALADQYPAGIDTALVLEALDQQEQP